MTTGSDCFMGKSSRRKSETTIRWKIIQFNVFSLSMGTAMGAMLWQRHRAAVEFYGIFTKKKLPLKYFKSRSDIKYRLL